jgi:hypothetical protein
MESISRFEAREELKRVLSSHNFAKAKKKSRFLEFVCEQAMLGNGDKLNEYLIGVEVYDRGPDFNPQDDAIVRVQACEIRRSLRDFYSREGKDDPWRIDLPPGHYVPVFARAPDTAPAAEEPPVAVPSRRPSLLVAALAVACLLLALALVRDRFFRAPAPPRSAAALPPGADWFWKPFLPPAEPPLLVLPNHPMLRAAHAGDAPARLKHGIPVPKDSLPEFRDTMHFRELREFVFIPDTTDFTGLGEALGLVDLFEFFAAAGQKLRVKSSRLVDFEALKRGNAILLGGNQVWGGRIFLYPEGFRFHIGGIVNTTPRPGEQPVYKPEFDPVTNSLRRDYALLLMLPNENRDQRILLLHGIYTQGTQAAMEYVANPDRLRQLRTGLLKLSPNPKYFQALLTTTVENGVPGQASLVAARLIPD